jgi:spore germination protein YaaH
MQLKGMRSRPVRATLIGLCLLVAGPAAVGADTRAATSATAPAPFRAHAYFDDTTGAPPATNVRGAPARPLLFAKLPLARSAGAMQAATSAPPDPDVLGFVQQGEVADGNWAADLHMTLLSTIAYFGVNVNTDGTLVTTDSGYSTWWSSQETNLINAAHAANDRVVLTVKAFSDATISAVTGTEAARQTLINALIAEVHNRPADGVNVDFEGASTPHANYTIFIAELQAALNARDAGHSYLTLDAYASAGLGGTMYDLAALWPHVDAIDLMGYGFEPCTAGHAGPSAPMGGCWYNDTQAVTDYMTRYGVPASRLLLGVPYYGYKWSVTGVSAGGQDPVAPTANVGADTYSSVLSDVSCAQQLQLHWDSTFLEPWAAWYSPPSGDPCGGNYATYRELYYDDAQSLGAKYDLVNQRGLRGIAIWALGYDSGTNDLWNEISAKFSVSKYPLYNPHGVQSPSVAVTPDGSTQMVFWRGPGNDLDEGWYSGGVWHGVADWTAGVFGGAARLASGPSAAITPVGADQLVFWEGPGGHLFEAWYGSNGWNGPVDWTAGVFRGAAPLASAPVVRIAPDGTQLVFWSTAAGHLEEAWFTAGHWNGPVDVTASAFHGAAPLASAPSLALTSNGTQVVFWQGPANHLFEAWYAHGWNGPVDWTASALGGGAILDSAPSVAVGTDGSTQVVFWEGSGGHLTEAWFAGGHWNGPADWTAGAFGGVAPLTSAPAVAVTPSGAQVVFWAGPSQTLWESWYSGGWNGPVKFGNG